MADSVDDEDSDLISLEKLSLTRASCFDCHCRCSQKQLESAVPLSRGSNRFTLCWPPRQSGGVVKASKRKATALNVDAVTNYFVSRKKLNSLSTATADAGGVREASAWGQVGAKADFGDLARLADVSIGPNERAACFTSSAYRGFGQRTALDVASADRRRRKNASRQKTDIVLTDLKSVLLAENGGDVSSCDSTLRSASDCSQSGHHLSTMPCSQQALVNDCLMDELDELTGYFEHYFHIPKKMSEMAKMMYA